MPFLVVLFIIKKRSDPEFSLTAIIDKSIGIFFNGPKLRSMIPMKFAGELFNPKNAIPVMSEIFPPKNISFNLSSFNLVLFEIPPPKIKSGAIAFIQPNDELNSIDVSGSLSTLLNQTSPYSPFLNCISKKPSNSILSVPALAYSPAPSPILGFKTPEA